MNQKKNEKNNDFMIWIQPYMDGDCFFPLFIDFIDIYANCYIMIERIK